MLKLYKNYCLAVKLILFGHASAVGVQGIVRLPPILAIIPIQYSESSQGDPLAWRILLFDIDLKASVECIS